MKRILIVSSGKEAYYFMPFLMAASSKQTLDILVFDTSEFPTGTEIDFKMSNTGLIGGNLDIFRHDVKTGCRSKENVAISSTEVAWYLRATSPIPKRMETDADLKFGSAESAAALSALWSVVPWRWINKKETIYFVEHNKTYQQIHAANVGLLVPETLGTNNHESVLCFAENDGYLLLKSYGYTDIGTHDDVFFYSNIFEYKELEYASAAIRECPIFAQRYVQKKCEYRVMVVGSRILSCRIDSQASEKTRIDWRHYDFENVRHEVAILPDSVNHALLQFMGNIGLKYGAVDLIETPDGKIVFLEVNPSGQWGWICAMTNLPIPEAVVEMLEQA